jgi:hypothetical protein
MSNSFLQHFASDQVSAGEHYDANDITLFMHIPKTAGMSVGKALQSAFDIFHPVSWENVGRSFRNKTRIALQNRMANPPVRQVLMGHFSWAEVMVWKNHELPIKCATIIRDPLDRFVSNYRYNCSAKHPHSEQFRTRFPNMEDYAQNLPHDYQMNLMLGMFYSFDHALEKLVRYYSFLGVTEYLDQSLEHYRQSHGLPQMVMHRENTADSRPKTDQGEEIPDSVVNLVRNKSHNDMRLHQLICQSFQSGSTAL